MGIERKTFLYFITDTVSGKSFYVDSTGQVQLSNSPKFLPQSPEGWLENKVTFGRSAHYYGINRTFTVPLKFVGDGATIIRYQFWATKGVECPLTLIILKWNDATDIFELYYKGSIDLAKMDDNTTESVTVNVIEGGIVKALKAFETTTYEIPCDGSITENIKINISGILFDCNYLFNVSEVTQENHNASYFFVPSFPMISQEGLSFDIETGSQFLEEAQIGGNTATYYAQSSNWAIRSNKAVTVTFTGQIRYVCTDEGFHPGRGALRLYFRTSLGNIYDIQTVFQGKLNQNVQVTRAVNATINLAAGEKLFLGAVLVPSATERLEIQFLPDSNINCFVQTKYKDTSIWAIPARSLFDLLTKKIGENKYASQSTLLDGLPNLAVTCGFALRGDTKAVIKTSMSDFFDSFNAVLNASLSNVGANDTLFFEHKEYVFDKSAITMDLGQVSNLKIAVAEEYFFNTLKIGYPAQSYDEKTGQYEYNTSFLWKGPNKSVGDKQLSLVSKYRADSIGAEYVRSHPPVAKSTTNNDSDNAVFILNIDAANPVADQYYDADKSIVETGISGTADVNFDTTTGQPYMTPNITNSAFTYNRTVATVVNITAYVTPQDAGSTSKTCILYKNATILGQVLIPAANGTSQGVIPVLGIALMPGDVIKVTVQDTGGGSPYSINQANLDIAFINIVSYNLKRITYDAVTGIPNPSTYYNIEDLTPKRILLNHGNWIRSVTHNLTAEQLLFQSCDKNPNLSTTKNGVTYTENALVPISSFTLPLMYPYVFDFDTKVPYNFIDLLNGAANGHIKFEFNGKTFYGFPIEVSQKPALNESQNWKLLLSPLNNLSDLEDLEVNGLNYLNLMGYQTFIPHLNPIQSVPLNLTVPAQYHFKTMDSDWFKEQIKFWTTQNNYFQPFQTNDEIHLQAQTNGLGPAQVELIDCNTNVLQTVALTAVTTAAVILPQILYQGNIALTGLAEGVYYVLWTFGTGGTTCKFISEGIYVKANFDSASEPTLLLEYTNTKNKQSTIFSENYNPSMRIYGWIDSYNPESKFAVYEDQPADIELLNGIPHRKFKLNIAVDDGVPDWVADKVNRIMLLDTVKIDGVLYTRNGDSKWEQVSTPGNPKKYWSLEIREAKNRDGITLDTNGIFDSGITVEYNINTKGFGDGAGSNNIVQITEMD